MLRVKAGVITRKKLLENIKFWSHILWLHNHTMFFLFRFIRLQLHLSFMGI